MKLGELKVGDTIGWIANPNHIDIVQGVESGKVLVLCCNGITHTSEITTMGKVTDLLSKMCYIVLKEIEEW
jgi:hypothetical protein